MNQEKMLSILEDTITYYGADVSKRSISTSGGCYYKRNDKACAVGRYMPNNLYGMQFETKGVKKIWPALKDHEHFKDTSMRFWVDLQRLHDQNIYWDDNGLSQEGYYYYTAIKRNIQTDYYI